MCYCLLLDNFVSTTKLLDLPWNIVVLHQAYILASLFHDLYERVGRGLFSKRKKKVPLQKASKTQQTWWLLKSFLQVKMLTAPCSSVCRRAYFGDSSLFSKQTWMSLEYCFECFFACLNYCSWLSENHHLLMEKIFLLLIRKLFLQYFIGNHLNIFL